MVELQDGSLLAAWYAGSGERKADDVVIEGAWLAKGKTAWSPKFLMADTPGYPDCNPALFAAPDGRSGSSGRPSSTIAGKAPSSNTPAATSRRASQRAWKWSRPASCTSRPRTFAAEMDRAIAALSDEEQDKYSRILDELKKLAGDELYQRLGWMPRVHPLVLPSGRWILPLYSDTFSASIMAISDDRGETWTASRPLIGFGNIQPSLVRKNDGELVAFMRDNGPHHRIRLSTFPRRRRFVVAGGRFPLSQPRRRDRGDPAGEWPLGPGLQRFARGPALAGRLGLRRRRGELEVDPARGAHRAGQGSVSLSVDDPGGRRLDPRDLHVQPAGPGKHDRARPVQRGLAHRRTTRNEEEHVAQQYCRNRRIGSHRVYPWFVVGLLWFCGFFNYADRQAVYSVFPLLKSEFDLSDPQLGLLGSAFMLVYALTSPFTGYTVDLALAPAADHAGAGRSGA